MRALLLVVSLTAVAAANDAGTQQCAVEPYAPLVRPKAKAPKCHRPPAKIAKSVRDEIAKQYHPQHGGKPQTTFPCDGLGAKIKEIVVETGGGHGFGLHLWRAVRTKGDRYAARGILYLDGAKGSSFTLAAGNVSLSALATVRAGLSASITEIAPPPKPNTIRLGSFSTSSRDFHLVIRLVDDDGRVLERRYTGYASSGSQNNYLGLEVARAALQPLTSLSGANSPLTPDDTALFVDRFNAAVPHFDDQFYWWVMERYVDLARHMGTRQTIAGLLTRLSVTDPNNRSQVDGRADAVDALAKITGWDARTGGRSVEEAAAAYLAACKTP